MKRPLPRSAAALTLVVVVVAIATSVATLVWPGAFPPASPATIGNRMLAEARGYCAATLFAAGPLALVALRAAWRDSLRGRLVLLGVLAHFVYTDLEFAVSPPFTALYLLYVAGFACALPALVLGVASVDTAALPRSFSDGTPRRTVAIFAIGIAALLATAWLKDIAERTLAGGFGWPAGPDAVRHVVEALDLGLQVPLGIATGVLLLQRRPTGLLLAAILLVNAVCMGAALTAMVLGTTLDAGRSPWSAAPFAFGWIVATTIAGWFFRACAPSSLAPLGLPRAAVRVGSAAAASASA